MMALRKTRRTEERRRLPEPTLPRIPTRGKTLPVPDVAPPPVPSPALEGLREQRPAVSPELAAALNARSVLFGQFRTTPPTGPITSVFGPAGIGNVNVGQRPSTGSILVGRQAQQRQVTQADLPQAGVSEGFDAALVEARVRAADFSDPMNTIEAAAGHVAVSFENGYSPPFIMYEVQAHWGWTDEQMKRAGYVRGLGGWTLDIGGEDLPTTTAGAGNGGAGTTASWSFPSLGNSRNSFAGSSLIDWRI